MYKNQMVVFSSSSKFFDKFLLCCSVSLFVGMDCFNPYRSHGLFDDNILKKTHILYAFF